MEPHPTSNEWFLPCKSRLDSLILSMLSTIYKKLSQSTFALPLDCFRIGVGILCILYLSRTIFEAPYFLGQDGLINHQLVQSIFWYTWQPLFYPHMSTLTIQAILSFGLILSLFLVIGFHSRISAFVLYLMVVCIYRYQFLVLFVDDVIVHLLLFWCFLLPTGKTLNLLEWIKNKTIMNQWIHTKVDSFALNLFLYNIALIYFVAGLSKFTSNLWLEGIALFATLKLPLGWFSAYPIENYSEWLKIGNYLALFTEPVFVLLVFLKPWSKFKLFLGSALGVFHLVILLTLDIPFANLGCLILISILFRVELMDLIFKRTTSTLSFENIKTISNYRFLNYSAVLMIILLTGAMMCALTQNQWRKAKVVYGEDAKAEIKISSADSGGVIQTAFYSGLWLMGLAQGYRLLDWIDERNFHQSVSIKENDGILKRTYPRSNLVPVGMRGSLILTYVSDVTWMYVDPDKIGELRRDLRLRLSAMYCRKLSKRTDVEVWHSLTRINSITPRYNQPEILLKFVCHNNELLALKE